MAPTTEKSPHADGRPATVADTNVAAVIGTLSSDPKQRTLPSGDRVVNYEVTCRVDEGPAVSVPVAWFDAPKRLPKLAAGDRVVAIGHVRRRFFRAGGATASRTEVNATWVASYTDRSVAKLATSMAKSAVAQPHPAELAHSR